MAKKHVLTAGTDKVTGVKGKDLFLGALDMGNATLTSDDKLNGGKGVDTVVADLYGGSLTGSLKNIEIGRFTNSAGTAASMDLAKATAMTRIVVEDLTSNIDFTNAAHVSSIELAFDVGGVTMTGIDAKATKTFKVNFDNTKNASAYLVTERFKQLNNLDVTLENSGASFGGAVDARTVTVHSHGSASNDLLLTHIGSHSVRNLVITGGTSLDIDQQSAFLDLKTFNAAKATGSVSAMIGGDHLTSVLGGGGNDIIALTSIAGSSGGKTNVALGKGDDRLALDFSFNAKHQTYDGGKGADSLQLIGAASHLSSSVKNFEIIDVTHASGKYDVSGMKLMGLYVEGTTSAASIVGLANDATVVVTQDLTHSLSISLASKPAGSASLQLSLYNGIDVGTASAGFSLTGVDHLEIHTFQGEGAIYLEALGTSKRMVDVTITGSNDVALHTNSGASVMVSGITVESSGGLDMSGFDTTALNSAGVTITGGAGDDVLVGGTGADTIIAGGGTNTILGSNGADRIKLTAGAGADTLVFKGVAQSALGIQGDTVEHFEIFDTIDISAIASGVTFVGNYSSASAGEAALLTAHASAYYNTTSHVLYIDLDHNKQLAGWDMQVTLDGVASFTSNQLIS